MLVIHVAFPDTENHTLYFPHLWHLAMLGRVRRETKGTREKMSKAPE